MRVNQTINKDKIYLFYSALDTNGSTFCHVNFIFSILNLNLFEKKYYLSISVTC